LFADGDGKMSSPSAFPAPVRTNCLFTVLRRVLLCASSHFQDFCIVIPENSDVIPTIQPTPSIPAQVTPPKPVTRWLGFLLVFAVVALSLWLLFNPALIARFGSWGYLGAFIVNLLASASIVFPLPGLPISIAMGVSMNPLLLALAAAAGSAVGELAGYSLGIGGRVLSSDDKVTQWAPRIEGWTRKYGATAIFAVAALPLPFDFAGIAAGAAKMPIWQFLVATFLGKFVKYYVVILIASGSLVGVRDMFGW
jgi:membrane protein YqaA with SNARE-associated domain